MKAGIFGLILVMAAAPAAAQSPFDGTFKIDVSTAQLPTKPWNRSLKDGVYSCSCDTPLSVKADGQWHKVQGQPYVDEIKVAIIGEDGLQIEGRKGGKPVYSTIDRVSPDGMFNNWSNTGFSGANGQPVKSSGRDKRVGPVPPKGIHRINGGWITLTDGMKVEDAGLTITLRSIPDGMAVTLGTGESYEARFGGPAVPVRNDTSGLMASLRRISATSFEETLSRASKPIAVNTFVVAPDMSLGVTSVNPVQKTTTRFKAIRM